MRHPPSHTAAMTLLCAARLLSVPQPVLDLSFDAGLPESAELKSFAPGEAAYLMPGPWGDCLDMTAAGRFGGTLDDTASAGSALVIGSPAVDRLSNFTVVLWMRASATPETASRILTKFGSWELMYARGRPVLLAVQGETKKPYRCPATLIDPTKEWTFVAVSVDRSQRSISLYTGTREAGLSEPATFPLDFLPDVRESELQVGNFNGIRPFKGRLDGIRIYAQPLSAEQIRELFERDAADWSTGERVLSLAAPPRMRAFRMNHADIPFRALSQSRLDSLHGWEMLQAMHATHLLWVYGAAPEPFKRAHQMGLFYQPAQNGLCGYQEATPAPSAAGDTTGRQQDLDGNKVVLPHMRKWKMEHPRWTGCHNNPDFRRLFFAESDNFIRLGADGLHVDDWMMAHSTATNGLACFCPACRAGFRQYLKDHLDPEELRELGIADVETFDYGDYLRTHLGITSQQEYQRRFRQLPTTPHFIAFQAEGLRRFYADWRQHLDSAFPGKRIPISVNNQACRRTSDRRFRGMFLADLIDFFQGEAIRSMQTADHFIMPCKVAEALNIPQVMMCKPQAVGASQAALATTYALGQTFRVPWDVYMDNKPDGQPAPRYMGKVEEWKPFYDFIHDHADLFNGFDTAAAVGVLFNLDKAPYEPVFDICARLSRGQIPFRLLAGRATGQKANVDGDLLQRLRLVIALHPLDSFSPADRAVIAGARETHRVRFFPPNVDLLSLLRDAQRDLLRLEGPENVYAFLRVNSHERRAVIHLVNWNIGPDGAAEPFANVTVSLSYLHRWGEEPRLTWYPAGAKDGIPITAERHRELWRITVPRLETWGVLEVRPARVAPSPQ